MNTDLHQLVSDILRLARNRGMSQKALAEMSQLDEAVISRLKTADDARFSTLQALGKCLGQKLVWVDDTSLAELIHRGELFEQD